MLVKGKKTGIFYENVKLVDGSYLTPDGRIAAQEYEVAAVYYSTEELQEHIEAAVEEYKDTQVYPLQSLHDESIKLKNRIAELEAERQPVEVTEADAAAIEWYKDINDQEWDWYLGFLNMKD